MPIMSKARPGARHVGKRHRHRRCDGRRDQRADQHLLAIHTKQAPYIPMSSARACRGSVPKYWRGIQAILSLHTLVTTMC